MKLTLKCAAACAFGAALLVPPRSACGQRPPTLRLTRDLRIDAAANDLTLIIPSGGITVSSQGTIAVTQNQDGAIRFFDAQGKSLATFGRKGQGPGEFQTFGPVGLGGRYVGRF